MPYQKPSQIIVSVLTAGCLLLSGLPTGLAVGQMQAPQSSPELQFVPSPQIINQTEDVTEMSKTVTVVADETISQRVRDRASSVLERNGYTVHFASESSKDTADLILEQYQAETEYPFPTEVIEKDDLGGRGEKNYFDAHVLDIAQADNQASITICGETDDAVYYGLATLDQILEQTDALLPVLTIEDYANTKYRGIVEGYYGFPFSKEDLLSLFTYGQAYKMNTFLYGPKTDPYHLGNWRTAYPTEETITEEERHIGVLTQEEFREICAAANAAGIDFVWGVSPMMQQPMDLNDPDSIAAGIDDMIEKYDMMYQLGVRQFALLLDDISPISQIKDKGDVLADLVDMTYQKLVEKYGKYADDPENGIKPLIYVPTAYQVNYNPAEQYIPDTLKSLTTIDPDIVVTFTGTTVFGRLEQSAAEKMYDQYIQRKPNYWWNAPVQDIYEERLYIGKMDMELSVDNRLVDSVGVLSNPMCHAEASKIFLHGVLDYAWNTQAIDTQANWQSAVDSLFVGDAKTAEAFRIFAEHSYPTDGRAVDQSQAKKLAGALLKEAEITAENAAPLMSELQKWSDACDYLIKTLPTSDKENYRRLFEELSPWLYKSQTMADTMRASLEAIIQKSIEKFAVAAYLYSKFGSDPLFTTTSLEGAGTEYYEQTVEVQTGGREISTQYMPQLLERAEKVMAETLSLPPKELSSVVLSNLEGQKDIRVEATAEGYRLSGLTGKQLAPGEYVGISFGALPALADLNSMVVPEGTQLQYSRSAACWYPADDADIQTPIAALRIKNMSAASIALPDSIVFPFREEKPQAEAACEEIPLYNGTTPDMMVDGDWETYSSAYYLEAGKSRIRYQYVEPFFLRNLRLVFVGTEFYAFGQKPKAILVPTDVEVSADGNVWEKVATLNEDVAGQHIMVEDSPYFTFTIENINQNVQYIRLTVQGNQNQWIKLCEMEVNALPEVPYHAQSHQNAQNIGDNSLLSAFCAKGEDVLSYQLLAAQKLSQISVIMRPAEAGLPIAEVLRGKTWVEVPMQQRSGAQYTVDLETISKVSDFRLRWDAEHAPQAIFDVSYMTQEFAASPDMTVLYNAYWRAEAAKEEEYSAEEWQTIQQKKAEAYWVLNSETSAEEVAAAAEALNQALDGELVQEFAVSSTLIGCTAIVTANPEDSAADKVPAGGTVTFVITPASDKKLTKENIQINGTSGKIVMQSDENGVWTVVVPDVRSDIVLSATARGTRGSSGGSSSSNYTLTFATNGGSAIARVVRREGSVVKLDSYVPTREGYTFEGWYADAAQTEKITSVTLISNATVYAKWSGGGMVDSDGLPFIDVNTSNWFYDAVKHAYVKDLMNGISATKFAPNDKLTRAMLAQILYNRAGKPAVSGDSTFTDIKVDAWYYDAVTWAAKEGIVAGMGDGTFAPNASITREQLTAMLHRTAGSPAAKNTAPDFSDAGKVSAWALDAVRWAVENDIMNGKGNGILDPQGTATRAEVAQMIMGFAKIAK